MWITAGDVKAVILLLAIFAGHVAEAKMEDTDPICERLLRIG
ncbi:MAG: hypothetical protein AAFV87_10475 [Pseudomonadota bacterium]